MHNSSDMARNVRLCWAENALLSHSNARSKTKLAIIGCKEPHPQAAASERIQSSFLRSLTYDELYTEVAQAASALRKLGVGPGDKVAALTPNNPGERNTNMGMIQLTYCKTTYRGCGIGSCHFVPRSRVDLVTAGVWLDCNSRALYAGEPKR